MRPTFWQRLDLLARRLTPFGISLVLVLINLVPTRIPELARIAPLLPLMAIYHWTIYRPELMPAVAVFTIGILQDTLTGMPIGVSAIVYLLVYAGVGAQRRFLYGKSFFIVWLGFSLVAAGAALLAWILVSAYNTTLVEPRAVFFQYLLTLGSFPVLAWVLLRWQRAFLRQD